jgi:predicted DNA binding CopG/RHH family protein
MSYNVSGMPRENIIQVRMTDEELQQLKKLADARGLSMSAYLRMLMKTETQKNP